METLKRKLILRVNADLFNISKIRTIGIQVDFSLSLEYNLWSLINILPTMILLSRKMQRRTLTQKNDANYQLML